MKTEMDIASKRMETEMERWKSLCNNMEMYENGDEIMNKKMEMEMERWKSLCRNMETEMEIRAKRWQWKWK